MTDGPTDRRTDKGGCRVAWHATKKKYVFLFNVSIIKESVTLNEKFSEIARYATKWPETTKELLEMQAFLISADQTTLLELNQKILALKDIWQYLLQEHEFTDEDLDVNLRYMMSRMIDDEE